MDCVWLIRRPLDPGQATDYATVHRLWDQAGGFASAVAGNRTSGPFAQLRQRTLQLSPTNALLLIGGRQSLAVELADLDRLGMSVQLKSGSGLGLFVSSVRQSTMSAFRGALHRGGADDPKRFTLIQLFQCPDDIKRPDMVVYFNEITVSFHRIWVVLVNNELIKVDWEAEKKDAESKDAESKDKVG